MGRAFEVRKASMQKTAAAKTKVYSRYGKEIYMAAKAGIPDPEMNVGLKRIIDEARTKQVPADVIKRAIEKAKGGSEENYHAVRYEGFGPGASSFIVECLTDNDNRTYSEVRNCFTKSKGKIGVNGSVVHGYEHVGLLSFESNDEEAIMEILLENDVELIDIEQEEGHMTVTVDTTSLHKAKEALESKLGEIQFDVLEITYLPNEYVTVEGEDADNFKKIQAMFDEVEDIQEVYHNVKFED
ncbi:YebC/PmpR family DNA-binding transcriptional regulator [Erysipelothrix rhusiopathiae]|uniref:YebC/PmpR family DNA-binding transcriptional regulator n=1 Tax=unclassified Erysipelothrix TaxID=2624170 RepID=UPI0013771559|nr:YebC/PmpR family DNA-binding transcriptional regulator [Erysipelothrix sp. strain 2 (EsS2-7-Brazil)]MBK2404376.1 YebC/PmpR family DNA-binding transcriptional regulator [Erysipelothrix sp. strain 2 (EsS2-7-Brazil)]NBA00587.1 YebC/PmpR family DNA-binding transcriptional regulator [Erysipelothrix rhusiopathiae]